MNLRKQVEPLGDAALQASSNRGMHTTQPSRLTWMKRWLKRACRHHAQSREFVTLGGSYSRPGASARTASQDKTIRQTGKKAERHKATTAKKAKGRKDIVGLAGEQLPAAFLPFCDAALWPSRLFALQVSAKTP